MQDVGQNGAHAGHGGRHVCAGALVQTESNSFSLTVVQMKWLPPHVGHTLPFRSAIQALTLLQSGKTTGKVLLQVNQ
jgi:hypothetical protein